MMINGCKWYIKLAPLFPPLSGHGGGGFVGKDGDASVLRLLDGERCGTEAKAIFGPQGAQWLLRIANLQAGLA